MGYAHIDNLYRAQDILLFRECWAMEKIHGTSAHVSWNAGQLGFFAGGESHENFVKLFAQETLTAAFVALGHDKAMVFGEAYGGRCQGMKATYGDKLDFVAFDVRIGETWLSVDNAAEVVAKLGLKFVHFVRIKTDLTEIDRWRDAPSEQAFRNGCADPANPETWKIREGVVLRPIVEMYRPGRDDGGRIICKHKRPEFSERKSKADTEVDPEKRKVLEDAEAIADEWVTDERLRHVLDKLGNPSDMAETGKVIAAMVEDVTREAAGEIADNKAARKAIGAKAAKMFKAHVCRMPQGAA